nr:bitter taste receptor T2R41 [Chrysocyon brachyurus]
GASRFCLQCVGMMNNFYYYLHLEEYSTGPARQFFGLHWDFLNSATFWFGSWLTVLFCMNIASFTHPTFLWLRWLLPGSVPWLLGASLLISFLVTLLFFWGNHAVYHGFLIRKYPGNMTFQQWSTRLEIHYFLPLKFITLSLLCSVFLVSIALLINSLRRHMERMRRSGQRLLDPHRQTHTRTMKCLVSFVILYALSFASLLIDATSFFCSQNDWYWTWQIIIYLCTTVHTYILMLRNRRLRRGCRQLLLFAWRY